MNRCGVCYMFEHVTVMPKFVALARVAAQQVSKRNTQKTMK